MLLRSIELKKDYDFYSYAKSGLILPGQCITVLDHSDPTSQQMANYFTHPDQIPVSKGEKIDNGIETAVTTLDKVIGYCRAGSVFPQTFGLACCAMEMIEVSFLSCILLYLTNGYRLLVLDSILSVLV